MRQGTRTNGNGELSRSMEDYLRAIYMFVEQGHSVSVSALATQLGVAAPSVTSMVKRLAELGLVEHQPYCSITLTEHGETTGRRLTRRYRLLQYYLVKTLGYSWHDVEAEADQLEHGLSSVLEQRIAEQTMASPSDDDFISQSV